MSLGGSLLSVQSADSGSCLDFFKKFKIGQNALSGHQLALFRKAHQVAFTVGFWNQKFTDIPDWAKLYVRQLEADSVELIPSIVFGNKRTLHLFERACIEDFLRYFYYFDHKIEHITLQEYPTKFQTIDFLTSWIKDYPLFAARHQQFVKKSCDCLISCYKELSRTVHGTIVTNVSRSDNLSASFQPLEHPVKEKDTMTLVFREIFFLLSLFHYSSYGKCELEEKQLVCQHLSEEQKRVLSGI